MSSPLVRAEMIPEKSLTARLRTLGAQFQQDKSKPDKHVYWCPSISCWILVERSPQRGYVNIGYYKTCPCTLGLT